MNNGEKQSGHSSFLQNLTQSLGIIQLIARRELAGYFSGLAGYVILAAHLLINGLLFNIFAVGNEPRYSQLVLEEFFYYGSGVAMITAILLGVRLIAEERQLKTLVLLRTSPISEREMVWGKFASALAFFSLTLLLSLYMPALIFVHGGPARQMLLGWHYLSFYHVFYGVNEWLTSQGYIVLSVNYRSGVGYGEGHARLQPSGRSQSRT